MAEETKEFMEIIPEAYRDTSWAKENAGDPEAFFKFVDNQNKMVGEKGLIIPKEGDSEDTFNNFYKTLGRPDTPEEYDLSPAEELKSIERDPEVNAEFKKLFHTTGVSKTAATKLSQGFEKIIYEKGKAAIEKQQAEDKAFADANTKLFGENRDTIVANAQKIIKADVPQELHAGFDKLDGEAMAVVVAITDSLYKKYGKEDAFKGEGGAGGTGETMDQLSAQQRKLMETPGYGDWRHADYASLKAQNDEIMRKMRAIKS